MIYHTAKDGRKILLKDLKTSHLINIIKLIERKAKEGVTIRSGGGSTAEDIWYDEYTIFGKDAKKYLNYHHYLKELKDRKERPHEKNI